MIMGLMTKDAFRDFSNIASPFLNLKDKAHYLLALELIEDLMQEAEDTLDEPLNPVIEMLSQAIETYENQDDDIVTFEKEAELLANDISVLRLIMDQYDLGVDDVPEIGSKSMVSRVLNGKRDLNKNHIKALSDRFGVNPNIFF